MLGILGLVCIDAQNDGAVFFSGHFPEAAIGIVPAFPEAQKIDFQRNGTFLCSAAQAADFLTVEGGGRVFSVS